MNKDNIDYKKTVPEKVEKGKKVMRLCPNPAFAGQAILLKISLLEHSYVFK
ncbi:MAG: hypothetical protein WDN26_00630 [Chitinophagaceae bacterium]